MFTGLIEAIGAVKSLSPGTGAGGVLVVDVGTLAGECRTGDSVAVGGVCLTVTRLAGTTASFGLSPETLARSTLGLLRPGAPVNLERALRPFDRLGGHIVQGHVDGFGTIRAFRRLGEFADIELTVDPELLGQMVPKGSVAVDGASLTIAEIGPDAFRVAAIPETLNRTTLGNAYTGGRVNIETDILVKIVRRQLEAILPQKQPLTVERLRQMGY
ncbi:MAG: riboflavin synthase [Planctomycetes bacterium]|jgi:riboflavin synthase|nr:riboflavin synthase [Planctomycetota bacterium]